MTDPIADMITRIKNAQAVEHPSVDVPFSGLKERIANLLVKQGFLEKSEKKFTKIKKILKLTLKYEDKKPFINEFLRVSKPSKRIYIKADKIKLPGRKNGTVIISTPKGLMTGKEARKQKLGGEIIAKIW